MLIPADADPYSIAEAIQKVVAAQTNTDARLAEQEWQRVVPDHGERSFSAEPAMSVRPTNFGVNVIVRYITRAHNRHEPQRPRPPSDLCLLSVISFLRRRGTVKSLDIAQA